MTRGCTQPATASEAPAVYSFRRAAAALVAALAVLPSSSVSLRLRPIINLLAKNTPQ